MMNLLKNLFKKCNHKLLIYGGGIMFKYNNKQYYIASENHTGIFKTEVTINKSYVSKILKMENNIIKEEVEIDSDERKIILNSLIFELEDFGYQVNIF